jgi:LPXTG-motif cell wall-anchored protein
MRYVRLYLIVLMLGLMSGLGSPTALAQTGQSLTLGPGGKATISFTAFCLDFGVQFPANLQAPNALAEDKVRAALAYIQNNNLAADQTKALDAQYAIWQLRGATGSPAGGAQAQAVVSAATTPPANPQGTSILDAAKANQVRLTVTAWQPIGNPVQLGAGSDHFYGQGTLTVENISNQRLALAMPVGTVFPPATAGSQTMAAFSTSVQITDPGQSAPQQLPNTGGHDTSSSLLFVVGALILLAAGWLARRYVRQP